jgi:hypothetical protein
MNLAQVSGDHRTTLEIDWVAGTPKRGAIAPAGTPHPCTSSHKWKRPF